MKKAIAFLSGCVLSFTVGCATIGLQDEPAYVPEAGKIQMHKTRAWSEGAMFYGQMTVYNMTSHDAGGIVTCNWTGDGPAFKETKDFELKPMTTVMLETSVLNQVNSRSRMHLSCEITYLICHDCGERIVINK